VVKVLYDKVRFWVTINEPMIYVYHAYILGAWPPQEKSFSKARIATDMLVSSHIGAHRLIHNIYKEKKVVLPYVSIAKNIQAFEPCRDSLRNRLAVFLRDRTFNFELLHKLAKAGALDFIGINYYTRSLVETKGWRMRNLFLDVCKRNHSQLKKNSLGWDIYPQGLYGLLIRLKGIGLPVFILENGICTADDNQRWEFICEHLKILHQAMLEGLHVLGYLYWSLIDNFEWDKGFGPRFGLIEVNYKTYGRIVRESARKFAEVCKTGILNK
jgi:beta-glucosidase